MSLPQAVRRLALIGLQAGALLTHDRPAWRAIAWASATCGVLGDARSRRTAVAALRALSGESTTSAAWCFAWSCWYERAVDAALAYQAERLNQAWAERHVAITSANNQPLIGSSVLVTIHHANQRLGFLRLGEMVERLGVVANFVPTALDGWRRSPRWDRQRALSRFSRRIFGSRMYQPARAARSGLDLLASGGSLIVVPDFYEAGPSACILGRRVPVADGAIWFARQSGRPIVPFVVSPVHTGWRLWLGERLLPERAAVAEALEDCIRRAPTAWFGWPDWAAAPACDCLGHPLRVGHSRCCVP